MISDNGFSETEREECFFSSLLNIPFIFLQWFRAWGEKRKALTGLTEVSLGKTGVCIPPPLSLVSFQTSSYS